MQKSRIIGLGSYLPEHVLTNQDLEKMVETSDEWIVSRTGIKERRIAAPHETVSAMGAAAAKKALAMAGIEAEQIDLILVCTMTPDYSSPSSAALIQHQLKIPRAAAVDIQAACTGFIYGLSMAKAYIESGLYDHVLVVAAEKMSAIMDYKDRNTCVLFGDGASAAVVGKKGAGFLINTICLGADGELADLIIVPGGGSHHPASAETIAQRLHYFKMSGKEVFKHAVRRMTSSAEECLAKAGLKEEQISWLIPHQANIRIMETLSKKFNIPEDKVYKTIHKYGNTSASSVAIALDELSREKQINPGDHLLLVAFGAGLTWGASILTKIDSDSNG